MDRSGSSTYLSLLTARLTETSPRQNPTWWGSDPGSHRPYWTSHPLSYAMGRGGLNVCYHALRVLRNTKGEHCRVSLVATQQPAWYPLRRRLVTSLQFPHTFTWTPLTLITNSVFYGFIFLLTQFPDVMSKEAPSGFPHNIPTRERAYLVPIRVAFRL